MILHFLSLGSPVYGLFILDPVNSGNTHPLSCVSCPVAEAQMELREDGEFDRRHTVVPPAPWPLSLAVILQYPSIFTCPRFLPGC